MLFGYFTLFVALVISAVAAYYSIVGLTAIFAAAVIPIIIMGAALEVGKVTAAVWLKINWHRARWTYKLYLVPAVAFLMVLTSMGIFGFLSKAHSDQSLVSGDVQSKIAIYDEKIKTARENIEANRRQLKQMDEAVDQVMGRSTSEEGATKANNIRRSQQRERSALARDIEAQQKLIATLNDEAAPIRAEIRKVEAEVGPIKYIAAMIYGDNPDANLLESAVRWVIILIVAVFDPLALVLILAAQQTLRWARDDQQLESDNLPYTYETFEKPTAEDLQDDEVIDSAEPLNTPMAPPAEESILDKHPYLTKPFSHFENLKPMVYKPEVPKVEVYSGNPADFQEPWSEEDKAELVRVMQEHFKPAAEANDPHPVGWMYNEPPKPKKKRAPKKKKEEPKILATGVDVIDRPGDYITPADTSSKFPKVPETAERIKVEQPAVPETLDRNMSRPAESSFGYEFPDNVEKGYMFLRVDYRPSKLFKYNGRKWIEVDKSKTDSYSYDELYIQYLIEKLKTGEYDIDQLSATEQDLVAEQLQKNNGTT